MSRRWSELTQVDRVDLYTRQSLYLLMWSYLVVVLVAADVDEGGSSVAYAVAVVGGLAVTAAGTAVLQAVTRLYPRLDPLPWRRLTPFLLLTAGYLAVGLGMPDPARGVVVTVVCANLTWAVGGLRDTRITVGLLAAVTLLLWVTSGDVVLTLGGVAIGGFFVFTVRVSLWLLGVVTELDDARQAQSALAVAEERLRFSRDVHDVLGRRLSTIAVQSELAATLAERGDDRATDQMLEVRSVAHEALREARELVRGYRRTELAQELEGARSLLRSAGVEVHLAVDDLPRGWHEAAGWVVRESVTNVLRHSSASHVEICWTGSELRVINDGVTRDHTSRSVPGTGLTGLRERLAPLGAAVHTERDGDSWRLVARLPGAGPLSATTTAAAR